jgi:hypothetical protein
LDTVIEKQGNFSAPTISSFGDLESFDRYKSTCPEKLSLDAAGVKLTLNFWL